MSDIFTLILRLDAGDPIVLLGGIDGGCYELFGTGRVKSSPNKLLAEGADWRPFNKLRRELKG